jgi:hypothetical protein
MSSSEAGSGYAAAAFKIIVDGGVHYIAGAVGCPPHLNVDAVINWHPFDISDIILWDPLTDECRVMGEAKSATRIVMPYNVDARLDLYHAAQPFRFFRAWAERRAVFWEQNRRRLSDAWASTSYEPHDSNIPGAFVQGDINKVQWALIDTSFIRADESIDPKALKRAIYRAKRIPEITRLAA